MTLPSQPDGYLATPHSGSGPGVLVLHAWWGLNATIKAFCDALAAQGFVAFAPDLYDGEVATTIEGAEALGQALDARHEEAKGEITQAVDFLAGRASGDSIAVIGFSLGAYYALDLAAPSPATHRYRGAVLRQRRRRLVSGAGALPRPLRRQRSLRAAVQRRPPRALAARGGARGHVPSLSRRGPLVLRARSRRCVRCIVGGACVDAHARLPARRLNQAFGVAGFPRTSHAQAAPNAAAPAMIHSA